MSSSPTVDLAPGVRTYIAHVEVKPNFEAARQALTPEDRKAFAYNAERSSEESVTAQLAPKLDALKASGLVQSYTMVPGTGAMIINVSDAKAGAAYHALQSLDNIGRIVRNHKIQLTDKVVGPAPTVASDEPGYNVTKVGAPEVWKTGDTGKGIVIGMVDTGADVNHAALKSRFRGTQADGSINYNYNWYDAVGGKTAAYDDEGHGTHTTGTAVGGAPGRTVGVAPGAKFIAAKVFGSDGSATTATLLKGLSWMLAPTNLQGKNPDPTKAPDIISNSWGTSQGSDMGFLDSMKAFRAAGILPVFAAGNAGPRAGSMNAPGSYSQTVSVAATNENDHAAYFSSRGPSPVKDASGQPIPKPDIAAPGVNIVSAKPGGNENQYQMMDGTSMATPAVAGVAALIKSRYPQLNADQIEQALLTSARDLGTPGRDTTYGVGLVNAPAAIAAAGKIAHAALGEIARPAHKAA